MVSVQSLQYFMKVYEKRSLNKAAADLYVTQPALSLAMKNLEQDLHMTLMTAVTAVSRLPRTVKSCTSTAKS